MRPVKLDIATQILHELTTVCASRMFVRSGHSAIKAELDAKDFLLRIWCVCGKHHEFSSDVLKSYAPCECGHPYSDHKTIVLGDANAPCIHGECLCMKHRPNIHATNELFAAPFVSPVKTEARRPKRKPRFGRG